MGGVEAGERNRQIEPEPEVGEAQQVARVDGGGEVVAVEPAFEDAERQLLVVTAESRVQALDVFDDRGLDLVEPVSGEAAADHPESMLAAGLLSGEEVAHAAGRGDR